MGRMVIIKKRVPSELIPIEEPIDPITRNNTETETTTTTDILSEGAGILPIAVREDQHNIVFEKNTNSTDKAFDDYFKRVDGKFNLELSEYAISLLHSDKVNSPLSPNTINNHLNTLSIDIPDYLSLGDITYLVNWIYFRLYPDFICSVLSCMNLLRLLIENKVLYKGFILKEWSKFMDREHHDKFISINWEEF